MAITLQEKKISTSLESVINGSIDTIRSVRKTEYTRRESEFQKAVNAGMSFDAQIKFRKEQLDEAKASPFSDEQYNLTIENSLSEVKRFARLDKFRNKYKESLSDYVSGKGSLQQTIDVYNDILSTEQDPDFRREVLDTLTEAKRQQNLIELNAIKNRAIVAEKDTSIPLVDSSIAEIQNRRALAAINKNDDEVAMLDDTLVALRGSKAKLHVENGENEITFQTNQKNLKSNDKLGLLNNYIETADISNPITYNGVQYPSLRSYWENRRNEYIAKDYFSDVQNELNAETNKIAATSPFGQIPVARIDAVNNFYKNVLQRPEFAPYKDKVEQNRIDMTNKMATDLQTSVAEEVQFMVGKGLQTEEQATAKQDKLFLDLENRFNIKLSRPPSDKEIAVGKTIAGITTKELKTPIAESAPTPMKFTPEQITKLNDAAERQKLGTSVGDEDKKNLDYAKARGFVPSEIKSTTQSQLPVQEVKQESQPSISATPSVPVEKKTENNIYVVKAGDTLSGIAQSKLGDASKALELKSDTGETYTAETAKKLKIGTKLILPK